MAGCPSWARKMLGIAISYYGSAKCWRAASDGRPRALVIMPPGKTRSHMRGFVGAVLGLPARHYPSDQVQGMAQRIASQFATSVCSVQEGNALAGVRNATAGDTARPVSLASVRHAGSSGNTKARRIASEVAATLSLIQNLDKAD
jgi:hypothetical protein